MKRPHSHSPTPHAGWAAHGSVPSKVPAILMASLFLFLFSVVQLIHTCHHHHHHHAKSHGVNVGVLQSEEMVREADDDASCPACMFLRALYSTGAPPEGFAASIVVNYGSIQPQQINFFLLAQAVAPFSVRAPPALACNA
ncbi:MAG: hypothetical protein AB7W37_05415 [Syntrophobacteraceae bacterium]